MEKQRRQYAPNFSRLVWLAQRPGKRGAEALVVLQDALMETFGPTFEKAIREAKRYSFNTPRSVTFSNFAARMIQRHPRYVEVEMPGGGRPMGLYPFHITAYPLEGRRDHVVVWDSSEGFNTHFWAEMSRPKRRDSVERRR